MCMRNYPLITLDFEASSLSETGYPIEVAVVLGDRDGIQAQFSTLIAPRPEWRGRANWSEASQAVHGIEFEWLTDAMAADTVCDTLDTLLAGRSVVVDGGTYDTFWLERLYADRSVPFHLDHLEGIVASEFNAMKRDAQARHRALPDATWLFGIVRKLRSRELS